MLTFWCKHLPLPLHRVYKHSPHHHHQLPSHFPLLTRLCMRGLKREQEESWWWLSWGWDFSRYLLKDIYFWEDKIEVELRVGICVLYMTGTLFVPPVPISPFDG